MAEQEVIKHTKKIFGLWSSNSPFLHKISEFLLEIFIIVFAVTISIYFHDRSELNHQRHETKAFLLGLKEDLKTDIEEMLQDKNSFIQSSNAFTYIINRKLNEPLSKDSLRKYNNSIFNITGLVPNNGRFEGFKSAGKIGTIENKDLQNTILDLYQENIPNLLNSTNFYTLKKQNLFQYVAMNRKRVTDSTSNIMEVLSSDVAYNFCISLAPVAEILNRYDTCIEKMRVITKTIDEEYKDQSASK